MARSALESGLLRRFQTVLCQKRASSSESLI